MTRKKTTRWLQAGGAALAVAAIAVVAFMAGATSAPTVDPESKPHLTATVDTPGEGSAHQAVLATVPDAPAEVMTTPATPEWWKALVQMFRDTSLDGAYPADAGVDLVGFAYSLNLTQGDNAKDVAPLFPALYVQTSSVEDAETLMAWFGTQASSDTRRTWRDGTVVLLVPSWVDQTVEFTLDTKSTTDTLAETIGRPDSMAVWTLNFGRYNTALTASASDDDTADRAQRLIKVLGFTGDSRFTVTATSPDGPWTGAARDVDPRAVNVGTANNLILGSGRTVGKTTLGDGSIAYMRETGMQNILRNSTFTAWGDGKPTNSIGIPDGSGDTLRQDNTDTVLTGRITLSTWASAIRGIDGDQVGATSIEFALAADGTVVLKPVLTPATDVVPGPANGTAPAVSPGQDGTPPAPAGQPSN